MYILGIHDGHCSSVCLMKDGEILYAEQEERLTYEKNQGGIPYNLLKKVDEKYGIPNIDHIAIVSECMGLYSMNRKEIIDHYDKSSGLYWSARQRLKNIKLGRKVHCYNTMKKRTDVFRKILKRDDFVFIDHHLCHASAAYYGNGVYEGKVLVITSDGEGDGRSGSVYVGESGKLKHYLSVSAKDSLARIYSYFTYLFNMVPYEHEYKIMGLAPYCTDEKRINEAVKELKNIIYFRDNNSLQWEYLGGKASIQAAGKDLLKIFRKHRFDVMSSALQRYTEEMVVEWISRLVKKTGISDLAMSGGLFMNVKVNMLIARIPEIKSFFVFPSCGDESNSIGAAYYCYAQKTGERPGSLEDYYLGDDIHVSREFIEKGKNKYSIECVDNIEERTAELLAKGEIVGRVKGKMEFGARSLGNRAILANPSIDGVIKKINEMIKGRDFWMPFAPSLLLEDIDRYFYIDKSVASYKYMMVTAESKEEHRVYAKSALHPYDYTGRPHTVTLDSNPEYYEMLRHYKKLTGESLVLNTSYNHHGYPIVYDQEKALHVFLNSGLQYLALGNYLLTKDK